MWSGHILAAERWSLLATRSQIWAEVMVMGRITAQFAFASASLVVLTVRVVGLNDSFRLLAVWLGVWVLITGSLTALRVRHAGREDVMLVVGVNRLRAAYVEIDPWVKHRPVTDWTAPRWPAGPPSCSAPSSPSASLACPADRPPRIPEPT